MGSTQSQPSIDHEKSKPNNTSPPSKANLAIPPPPPPKASNPLETTSATHTPRPHLTKTRPGLPKQDATSSPLTFSLPSPPNISIFIPTLQFGSYSAAAGLFFGSFHGILRSDRPYLFSFATGVQWGLAGTAFHGVRSLAIHSLTEYPQNENSRVRLVADVLASAAAGGVMGATAGGARSVGPGMAVFGLVGLGGHWVNEKRLERRELIGEMMGAEGEQKRVGWIEWVTTRKWSPIQMLSDEEYREIMMRKLLKVEAEIAVLEDDVKAIRERAGKGDG